MGVEQQLLVLHADDNDGDVNGLVSDICSAHNIRVEQFTDPRKALEEFRQNPAKYSAVVSDYRFNPRAAMTGIMLLEEIKRINPAVPRILYTAEKNEEIMGQKAGMGEHYYVSKLGKTTEFAETIKTLARTA